MKLTQYPINIDELEQRPAYYECRKAAQIALREHRSNRAVEERIRQRAERRHVRLLGNARAEAKIFINQAIDHYLIKRDGDWEHIDGEGAYGSFDAYLAVPHERMMRLDDGSEIEITIQFNPSTAHLGVQVTFDLMYLFWIRARDLMDVGQKKLALLIPFFERQMVPRAQVFNAEDQRWYLLKDVDPVAWNLLRQIVALWIEKAKRASYNDLAVLLGKQEGWETGIRDTVPVSILRSFTHVSDLLQYLGVNDLPASKSVQITTKWKR